jgi:hypothetical protein
MDAGARQPGSAAAAEPVIGSRRPATTGARRCDGGSLLASGRLMVLIVTFARPFGQPVSYSTVSRNGMYQWPFVATVPLIG